MLANRTLSVPCALTIYAGHGTGTLSIFPELAYELLLFSLPERTEQGKGLRFSLPVK